MTPTTINSTFATNTIPTRATETENGTTQCALRSSWHKRVFDFDYYYYPFMKSHHSLNVVHYGLAVVLYVIAVCSQTLNHNTTIHDFPLVLSGIYD